MKSDYLRPVATLVLNRPAEGNPISSETRRALIQAVAELERMPQIAVVVIAGAGDAFSIGGDSDEMANLTVAEAEAMAKLQVATLSALRSIRQPLVAAIKGPCTGVGFELALTADIRFARADSRFGLPGINLGITPAGGSVSRLNHLIGGGPGRALLLTGSVIDAERAFGLGLLTAVLSAEEFDTGVNQIVGHMASLSPVAVAELKNLIDLTAEPGLAAADKAGIKAFTRCYAQGDANQRWHTLAGGAPKQPRNLH
jgi:enoyl-CoA hydratase/carnithine racemase